MKLTILSIIMSLNIFAAQLDTSKSMLEWTGAKITEKHNGQISFKEGTLVTDGNQIKSGNFTVDMDSMTVTDITGNTAKKFLGHVKSGDFFEVKKYPTAKLNIKSVKGNQIMADLTVKGKTNPVKFDYKKKGNAFVGKMTFDRTKFDIKYKSKNFFENLVADKVILDEVTLDFKLVTK